ncbi:ribosome-inactivating family protein [Kitasatospora sp. NPDC001539]|uniref:ribosome-inactivating family protein n=1 Tax=unclassified Kitasatospora TaxID=2633591 RepID=UPI00331DF6A7
MLALLCIAFTAFVGSAGTASADVPFRSVRHVWLDLDEAGNAMQQSYTRFITSLREASGHDWQQRMRQTQVAASGNELIRADLNSGSARVQLWISPGDLYVRGFTAMNGVTYYFVETGDGGRRPYNLGEVMNNIRRGNDSSVGLLPSGRFESLRTSSNYGALSQVANRALGGIQFSFGSARDAIFNLAYTTNPGPDSQHVARSLMSLIQFTSEAARFWEIYSLEATVMANGGRTINGLPGNLQDLEHNWGNLSDFSQRLDRGENPPAVSIPSLGVFRTLLDVANRLAMIQSAPTTSQVKGDPWHTEL